MHILQSNTGPYTSPLHNLFHQIKRAIKGGGIGGQGREETFGDLRATSKFAKLQTTEAAPLPREAAPRAGPVYPVAAP